MSEKVTAKRLLAMAERQDFRCALSGVELTPQTAAADHVLAIANGGENIMENIQILHHKVNTAKGTMGSDEFIRMCVEVAIHSGGCIVAGLGNQSTMAK